MFSTFHIDPAYLRFVYDGLQSGSINKDNLKALPQGLAGMYDDAIPPKSSVRNREKFLSFFTACSLFKKEVSPTLIADLLNWREHEVVDYLSVYTKWFNSPVSGRYLLYHERLRVFLLGKISPHQLDRANQSILSKCQMALERQDGGEWEVYALEHLPAHLLIPAVQHEQDSTVYKRLVYDNAFWSRQLEISKGFDWTKKMLNQAMGWAAKQGTDELIECALNKIDLHHMEQNDAPRIVELVAQNDIETALQRIESFGGNDKEGLQRKFILYMLCLMELSLLDSKDKPFRKDAIEKLLKHFDEQIPTDKSILDWDDFFPSYLMFQLAHVWAQMGFDYRIVYKRTEKWDASWILENMPYNDLQITLLLNIFSSIRNDHEKSKALKAISIALAQKGEIEKSLSTARLISEEGNMNWALREIVAQLAHDGKIEEALSITRGIDDDFQKSWALREIAIELAKQGKIEEVHELIREIINEEQKSTALKEISKELVTKRLFEEALEFAISLKSNIYYKNKVHVSIAIAAELAIQGNIEGALNAARLINDEFWKSKALKEIAAELAKQGKADEAHKIVFGISNEKIKCETLAAISAKLVKQGNIEESLRTSLGISDDYLKSTALKVIVAELAKKGKVEKSLSIVSEITDKQVKSSALKEIAVALALQGKINESLSTAFSSIINRGLDDYYEKNIVIKEITLALVYQKNIEELSKVLTELLIIARGTSNDKWKNRALIKISAKLAAQGKIEKSLSAACGITDKYDKIKALEAIAVQLAHEGKIEESLSILCHISNGIYNDYAVKKVAIELVKCNELEKSLGIVRGIGNGRIKSIALKEIAAELVIQEKKQESLKILEESMRIAIGISEDDELKNLALEEIAIELAKQGMIEESMNTVRSINYNYSESSALNKIATELSKQTKAEESSEVMEESLKIARGITDDGRKSLGLTAIAVELAKQGKIVESSIVLEESHITARCISNDYWKSRAFLEIAVEKVKQGKIEDSLSTALNISEETYMVEAFEEIAIELAKLGNIDESLSAVRHINDDYRKGQALKKISVELVHQENIEESLIIARRINDKFWQSWALSNITLTFVNQANWILAEKTGLEISEIADRLDCWKKISEVVMQEYDPLTSFSLSSQFKSIEAQSYYLKGWSEEVNLIDINSNLLYQAIYIFENDVASLETLLQKYALNQVFFDSASSEKLNRLNHTLNIQWAIDIANNFNRN